MSIGNVVNIWLGKPQGERKWWQWTGLPIKYARRMYQTLWVEWRRIPNEAALSQKLKCFKQLRLTIH
jgi:hypothetical protein